jgi:hypothetical protein
MLRKELSVLRAINAAASGVPVDMNAAMEALVDASEEEMLRANVTFIEVAAERGIKIQHSLVRRRHGERNQST